MLEDETLNHIAHSIQEGNKSGRADDGDKRIAWELTIEELDEDCSHIFTTAEYVDKKLQGYKCKACKKLIEVNPNYKKRSN